MLSAKKTSTIERSVGGTGITMMWKKVQTTESKCVEGEASTNKCGTNNQGCGRKYKGKGNAGGEPFLRQFWFTI